MYTYKTRDGKDLVIAGVGSTHKGVIVSDVPIENPNLEQVMPEETDTENEQPEQTPPMESNESPSTAHVQAVAPPQDQGDHLVNSEQQPNISGGAQ